MIFNALSELSVDVWILAKSPDRTWFSRSYVSSRIISFNPPFWLRFLDTITRAVESDTSHSLTTIGFLYNLHPDYIVVDNSVRRTLIVWFFKHLFYRRSKIVYDMYDLCERLSSFGRKKRIFTKLMIFLNEVFLPKVVDKVVVVTKYGRRYLISKGIPREKVFILGYLTSLEIFKKLTDDEVTRVREKLGIKDDTRVLLWQGSLRSYQIEGLKTVIKALSLVQRKMPNLTLLVVGDGKGLDELKGLAKALNTNVVFTGWLTGTDYWACPKIADVGIQALPEAPFTHFIHGTKLTEYIAAGLPVLCSALEGPSELVQGNGLTFTPRESEDLAKKIEQIFRMNLNQLSLKSIELAEQEFSWQSVVKKITELTEFLKR